jgi:hypothetical protein
MLALFRITSSPLFDDHSFLGDIRQVNNSMSVAKNSADLLQRLPLCLR